MQMLLAGKGGPSATLTFTDRTSALNTAGWASSGVAYGAAWDGSQFMLVGEEGGNNASVATSADAITWTQRVADTFTGSDTLLRDVVWTGSQFVVVGHDNTIATSPDGVTWTQRTGPTGSWGATTNIHCVCWSGSLLLIGGEGGRIATSPDGVTWTDRPSLRGTTWGTTDAVFGVGASGSMFVAVGNTGKVARSADGTTWTYIGTGAAAGLGAAATLYAAHWDGSKFIIGGVDGHMSSSPDAVTWTLQNILRTTTSWGLTRDVYSICYDSVNQRHLVVGENGYVANSLTDLTSYTVSVSPVSANTKRGIAVNGSGLFIIGGETKVSAQ